LHEFIKDGRLPILCFTINIRLNGRMLVEHRTGISFTSAGFVSRKNEPGRDL
jgi:hypothetical protein